MAALGAELTIVESHGGGMDAALTRTMVEAARRIAAATGAFWTDQLKNTDHDSLVSGNPTDSYMTTRELFEAVDSVSTQRGARLA